ncbi:uncharacterized protein LOC110460092 isoform X2 [Mizuhopecten yessoensis]|uniref:uncharacterized protein LOC110460092 isoform X2 n=1 Tax=Mizuhopecten yessoensis TaxID=6573 RepID=UPI000B458F9A|nr:uncharacterized protein LOC110460092 isoform X2 [Mizuhopecten yessoensis]
MGLLQVCVGVLLLLVLDTWACDGNNGICGCIFTETTEIEEDDYVCEPIRSEDFQYFLQRLSDALHGHWNAYTFVYSFPDNTDPPEESGTPLCPTERKQILGYFKNNGLTLCWVVYPHQQDIKKAECTGEGCCGDNTRCDPGGYVLKKYLVYCDALYTDEDGCLIGTDELGETTPSTFDETDFNGPTRRKREADASHETIIEREKRTLPSSCPPNEWYFAFKHDYIASTCSCRRCVC